MTRYALPAVAVAVNAMVCANAVLHSPFVGYDADDHLSYIRALGDGHLPRPDDTRAYFVPPLPYVVPAALSAAGLDWGVVIKAAQLQNVAWSIGLTLAVIALARRLGTTAQVPFWSLLLLGTMPLYYKMFAFIRGEALTAFLAVALIDRAIAFSDTPGSTWRGALGIGLLAGLAMLSKQWAVFVVMPVLAWVLWQRPREWRRLLASAVLAAAVGGWFYASLQQRFGTVAAFVEPPAAEMTLANRPPAFYAGTGWPAIVTTPVREAFAAGDSDMFWPVLYSETWGDYFCYWAVRADAGAGWLTGDNAIAAPAALSNRGAMAPFLGRANVAGLLPTAVMVAGLAMFARHRGAGLLAAIVGVTLMGYLALLIAYPALDVKPGYQLHAAPLLAVLGALLLTQLPPWPRRLVQALVVAAAIHNAPLFVTHFPGSPFR